MFEITFGQIQLVAAGVFLVAYIALRAQRSIAKLIAGSADVSDPLFKSS